MKDTPELVEQAGQAIRTAIERVPFAAVLEVQLRPEADGPTFVVRVGLPEAEQVLVVEFHRTGQPRLALQAVNRLLRFCAKARYANAYPVFMAPYISDRSAALCEEESVGYLDLAGNCRLCFQQVYIHQAGAANPFSEKRELRTLFSPKATRILRVLLMAATGKTWKVQALADAADVSLGQVSNVKSLLADRQWIETGPDGLQLVDPDSLLQAWAAVGRPRGETVYRCYSLTTVPELELQLAAVCNARGVPYALTAFAAASRLAPMVRTDRVTAYIASDVPAILRELGIKEVTSGSNVDVIEPYDEGVFYDCEEIGGVTLASPVQVYLDLTWAGGRGEDAAEAILNEVLRST